jgi:hypothetical protein
MPNPTAQNAQSSNKALNRFQNLSAKQDDEIA